ncbi:hypothetical protein D9M68_613010 [compost metagenome]
MPPFENETGYLRSARLKARNASLSDGFACQLTPASATVYEPICRVLAASTCRAPTWRTPNLASHCGRKRQCSHRLAATSGTPAGVLPARETSDLPTASLKSS